MVFRFLRHGSTKIPFLRIGRSVGPPMWLERISTAFFGPTSKRVNRSSGSPQDQVFRSQALDSVLPPGRFYNSQQRQNWPRASNFAEAGRSVRMIEDLSRAETQGFTRL